MATHQGWKEVSRERKERQSVCVNERWLQKQQKWKLKKGNERFEMESEREKRDG